MTAIRVNRAPVLTLWAAVVAERLGHAPDTALSLASAVAGTAAQAKARRLGLAEQHDHVAREIAPRWTLRLLGREIATVEEGGTLLAAHDGKPSPAEPVRRYVERAFGVQLTEVRAAMTALAARLPPAELNRVGFKLYEAFRPEVPDGVKGWGAKGELRIESIAAALDQLPSTDG